MPPLPGPRAMLCCTRKPVNISILPVSIMTGKCTMISREGVLSTFHNPSSRFSLRAANSNRALCASQGLISWSNVITGAAIAIHISISNACRRTVDKPNRPLISITNDKTSSVFTENSNAALRVQSPAPAVRPADRSAQAQTPVSLGPPIQPRQACALPLSRHYEPSWETLPGAVCPFTLDAQNGNDCRNSSCPVGFELDEVARVARQSQPSLHRCQRRARPPLC